MDILKLGLASTKESWQKVLTLIVLHKYTHVKPAVLPYLRVTASAE